MRTPPDADTLNAAVVLPEVVRERRYKPSTVALVEMPGAALLEQVIVAFSHSEFMTLPMTIPFEALSLNVHVEVPEYPLPARLKPPLA